MFLVVLPSVLALRGSLDHHLGLSARARECMVRSYLKVAGNTRPSARTGK